MNIEAQVRRLLGETVGPYDWENVPADEDLRRDGMNSLNCISSVSYTHLTLPTKA